MAHRLPRGLKRKWATEYGAAHSPRPRRIPSLHNRAKHHSEENKHHSKENKHHSEDKRKVLRMSIHKLRRLGASSLLLRSVLVNNTRKKLERELRQDRIYSSKRLHQEHYVDDINNNHCDILSNEPLQRNAHLFETSEGVKKVMEDATVDANGATDSTCGQPNIATMREASTSTSVECSSGKQSSATPRDCNWTDRVETSMEFDVSPGPDGVASRDQSSSDNVFPVPDFISPLNFDSPALCTAHCSDSSSDTATDASPIAPLSHNSFDRLDLDFLTLYSASDAQSRQDEFDLLFNNLINDLTF